MAKSTGCSCPEIDDQEWHMKDMDWSGKFFYFDSLTHFFFAPMNYGKKLETLKDEIRQKGYRMVNPDMVLNITGMFQGKMLIEIEDPEQLDANVEPFENARVLSRVYRGPYSQLKKAIGELKAFTQDRTGVMPNAIYRWYTTCPKCAQGKGSDKTVLFARV